MKDILLVDDELPFLRSLAEGIGFYSRYLNVITAENGRKAVEILRTAVVDVVVTDLKMPEMDGFEVLRYMRNKLPNVPVIVMTAYGDSNTDARLKELGVVQCLEKPLDFKDVIEKILAADRKSTRLNSSHQLISYAVFCLKK